MKPSIGFKVVGYIIAALLTSWVATQALSMMNAPSDLSVSAGIVLLLALGLGWFLFVTTKLRKRGKQRKAKKSASLSKTVVSKALSAVMLGGLAMSLSSCAGCSIVSPGYVGIKVNMTGDSRGVDQLPLQTGWVFYNMFTQKVFEYPTFVQTAIWTKNPNEGSPNDESITFNSKEGLVISGDISLSYQLQQDKVPAFYVKFRSDDLNLFTHGYLHNVARDAFNEIGANYTVDQIYGEGKDQLLKQVVDRINSQVQQFGVQIIQFGFTGALRLPQGVVDALNAKITATQKAMQVQNEVLMAQAEAQKKVAIAQGEAKANQILTQSITDKLLEWRRLQITEEAVQRWNGQRPMVEGQGGGMLLQIPIPQK